MKSLFSAALLAASLVACSSDTDAENDPHKSDYPSCEAISNACHDIDTGTGIASECHKLAHDATSNAPCAAREDECVSSCTELANSSGDDAGSGDGGSSSGGHGGHDH